jgi:DNA polymerase-1
MGHLTSGVIYGFLRDVVELQRRLQADRMVFCFEGQGKSIRKKMYSLYKHRREEKLAASTEEEKQSYLDMKRQLARLRDEVLPELGYRNIFHQRGYESDDIIASVCIDVDFLHGGQSVIVTSDKDLYQLLSPTVSIWDMHHNELFTDDIFRKIYGIGPAQWVDVKAIAGCGTDDIGGILGVGEKTAIKFLTGKLKTSSKAYQKIIEGNKIWTRNLKLVRLPLPGLEGFRIRKDRVTDEKWMAVTGGLGMKSLRGRAPGIKQKQKKSLGCRKP